MARHESKHAQRQFGIAQCFLALQEDPAVHHGELGIREPRPQILKLAVERRARRRKFLQKLQGDAMNQPRLAEINSHPIRRGERVSARRPDFVGGCLVLRHPCKRIVVAPMSEVEKAAYRHQKIESGVESFTEPRRQQRIFVRPCALFLHRGNQRKPVSEVVIAQPARAVLHIGLQVEDGVSEFIVAAVGQVRQALDDGSRLARHQLGDELIVQPIE